MSYNIKRITRIISKVLVGASAVISAAGTSMAFNVIDVLAAPASTYSVVQVTDVDSEGDASSLEFIDTHNGESFHATTGIAAGAISADADDILSIVPEVRYTNASFDVDKNTGSYVTIIVTGSAKKDAAAESESITNSAIVTHGSATDSAFRKNIANRLAGLISGLPDVAETTLGEEYANESLQAESVKFIYYTRKGDSSSSDFERKVTYHVAGSETGTSALNNTTDILEIGDTVSFPAHSASNVFDGWYLDEDMTVPFSGIVNERDFAKDEITDVYGSIVADDGSSVNYTVYAYDTSTGTVESGQAKPIEGVTVTMVNVEDVESDSTGISKITDSEGKAVFTVTRGNWIISETKLPTVPESTAATPMIYTESEPNRVQVLYASGTLDETSHNFLHDRIESIVVHFELGGGSYPEPILDQKTAKGGYVINPGIPVKEVNGVPFTFLGWFKDGATEPYDFTSSVVENSSFTLTAKWGEPNVRTVHVVFTDVNPTQPQDITPYNFDVDVYDSMPMTTIENSEGSTIADIIAELLSAGYLKENDSDNYDSITTYGDGADETISVKMVHRVDSTNGTASENHPKRTIHYVYEDGSTVSPDMVQTATISTVAPGKATDAVTSKETDTAGQTIVKNGWGKVTSPVKAGYRADLLSVGETSDLDDLNTDVEITVIYRESPTLADVTVTLIGNNAEIEEYDGEDHALDGYEVVITDETNTYKESDFTYSGTSSVTGRNAGVYSLGLDVSNLTNNNENYNVRFVVRQGYLTINRKHVTVIPDDKTKLAGEPDPEFTATVEGLLGDDAIQYTLSRTEGNHPTTKHPIYVNCVRIQGNYYVDVKTGILTIESDFEPSEKPVIPVPPEDDHGYIAWHTDRDDTDQTVSFPGIRTTAKDITNDVTYDDKADYFFIEDTVEYTGLTPNKRYTMTGTLMDKLTGEAIETEPVNKQFRPSSSDGVVVLEFKVPREAVNGMTVVVFEECTLDGKAVAIHADIEDAAQTVRLVEKSMRTTATAGAEGGKILHLDGVSEKAVIVDTVSYTGLVPNRNYTVSGTIHINNDGADAGTLKTEDGEDIVVTKTFAPSESDGTVEMQFEFDSSLLSKDQKLVVFEELYLGSEAEGEPILTHKDISDENQTVTVDEVIINIRTTALSGDGTKNVMADEEASVVDKVVYEGLTVGESYQLKGELHLVNADGSDGGVIAEGRTIDFTPGAENGTALMEFTFDAHELAGRSVVVFEYLYKDDVLIATHTDITDEGQTVVVKQFSTTAVNYSDKTHHVTNKIPVSIDDTIQYSGLIPGQTYEAFGEIHLVRNGTDMGVYVDQYGNEAVASVTFSASDSGNGDVIVPFDFGEGNLDKDDKLVVFETIYIVNGDQKEYIGEHKDINDADQTITVTDSEVGAVEIQTTATADGEKSFVAGTDATIVDTVIINGVRKIAGEECVLEGELHIKNNGIDGGTIGSVVRREFTVPLRTESVVELEMIFSGIDLKQYPVGTEFVVFEKLYRVNDGEEILLAEHADIEDTDQTVSVVAVKPSIKTTATGENGLSKVVKTSENVKIVDTVTYTNLVPGKEYTLKGTLHLVNEGKDEKILKTEYATFIPTSANGTIKVTFTIDTSTLKGRSLVVFEDLFEGSVIVASHSDIKDKDQTVVVENDVKPVPTSTPTPTPSGETITSVSTPSGLPSYLQNTGTGYGVFVAAGFLVVAVIGLIVINKPKK